MYKLQYNYKYYYISTVNNRVFRHIFLRLIYLSKLNETCAYTSDIL